MENVSNLKKFIDGAMTGKTPLHFDSAVIPKEHANLKMLSGQDYAAFTKKSNMGKSKLVLISHPNDKKNWGIVDHFDRFAAQNDKSMKDVIATLYPGLNESESFKTPSKLPTLLLYKKGAALTDDPVEIDRNELLKCFRFNADMENGTIDKQQFDKIVRKFLKDNNK